MIKRPYLVELFKQTCDYDTGDVLYEYSVYKQKTWACSKKQAENNVRHNSQYPFHGRVEATDGGRWYSHLRAEVTEL